VIGLVLVVASVRLRLRGGSVRRVEEELGLAEGLRAEAVATEATRPE